MAYQTCHAGKISLSRGFANMLGPESYRNQRETLDQWLDDVSAFLDDIQNGSGDRPHPDPEGELLPPAD